MFFDTNIGRNFVRVHVENVVVICHGLPYEPLSVIAKGYDDLAGLFAEYGLNSVLFDFSGTGLSSGTFRILNWIEDLIEIVERFKSVHLVGFSLGGVPATYVSRLSAVRSLVLVAVPCSLDVMKDDLIRKAYENAVAKKSLRGVGDFDEFMLNFRKDMEEFAPIKWIGRINKPVLLVHGTDDDVIPIESSRIMYERAVGDKYFLEVKNGDHRLRNHESVMRAVAEWILMYYKRSKYKWGTKHLLIHV